MGEFNADDRALSSLPLRRSEDMPDKSCGVEGMWVWAEVGVVSPSEIGGKGLMEGPAL